MSKRGDEDYFNWLYSRFGALSDKNPKHTYRILAQHLLNHTFYEIVPNDSNRAIDGLQLRWDFLDSRDLPLTALDHFGECTVLEMMVALTEVLVFETSGSDMDRDFCDWFWVLLSNLNLTQFHDESDFDEEFVSGVIDRFVRREYYHNGGGGLFPLKDTDEDQRDVEIWYQAAAYILERSDIGD